MDFGPIILASKMKFFICLFVPFYLVNFFWKLRNDYTKCTRENKKRLYKIPKPRLDHFLLRFLFFVLRVSATEPWPRVAVLAILKLRMNHFMGTIELDNS